MWNITGSCYKSKRSANYSNTATGFRLLFYFYRGTLFIMPKKSLSIVITGSGGSGAVTAGLILLEAMAKAGFYGYMSRSAGPQIRGGESAVMMRFSMNPVCSVDDSFDVLLALDWNKFERFADEIPLDQNSLIISDRAAGDLPVVLEATGAKLNLFDFTLTAKSIAGGRANMLGLGVVAKLIGLDKEVMQQAVHDVLGKKGEQVVLVSRHCIELGMEMPVGHMIDVSKGKESKPKKLWNISGNEACGLGALRAGVRFVAAYPITPASDILEWLAPNLEKVGGVLLQAEDELASINMIIGASFGGVPSLTATSGPGLSLMMEGLGLAVASETPIVAIDVMRGGPSTGIPTKSEQSDLNLALYGLHGDAPHLVLAALDIGDCVFTTQWAVCLAEQLQTLAIVLSDQSLGQSRVIMDPPQVLDLSCDRKLATSGQQDYQRYQLEADGISAMSIPGTPSGMYTADGLEHDEHGIPSSMAIDHEVQLNKRLHKLKQHDYGDHGAQLDGLGEVAIITWGSSSAVCIEAATRLREQGIAVTVIALRLLMPLDVGRITEALKGCRQVFVVEQNQTGQFYHYLLAQKALVADAISYARPGPLPIRPREIVNMIQRAQQS
jgi:2-oxoglutarate ferredoxin oxidoreductase subunit alpha